MESIARARRKRKMIEPSRFAITQSDIAIIADIHVPNINENEVQIVVEDCEFTVSAKPFMMSVKFKQNLLDIVDDKTTYSRHSGILHFEILKQKPGQPFDDLPLIGGDLLDEQQQDGELVDISRISCDDDNISPEILDIDWNDATPASDPMKAGYGFMNAYHGMFVGSDQMPRLFELFKYFKNVEDINEITDEGSVYRIFQDFDEDEFIADAIAEDDSMYDECVQNWKDLWWLSSEDELSTEFGKISINDPNSKLFNGMTFKRLDTRGIDIKEHLLCLSSLVYAYCHAMRTFGGEISSDSLYSLVEMTPVLSAFYRPKTISAFVDMQLRCAISKPLFRIIDLHELALQDVCVILGQGRRGILKLLKYVYDLFESDSYEDMWRFNEIWIKDMLQWIYKSKWMDNSPILRNLAEEISKYETDYAKCEINGWTLAELQEIIDEVEE